MHEVAQLEKGHSSPPWYSRIEQQLLFEVIIFATNGHPLSLLDLDCPQFKQLIMTNGDSQVYLCTYQLIAQEETQQTLAKFHHTIPIL